MKFLSLLLLSVFSLQVFADEMQTLKDFIKNQQSTVWVETTLAESLQLKERPINTILGTIEPIIKIKPQKRLSFLIGEDYLEISSNEALVVEALGINIKISHILYNQKSEIFEAKTSLPFNLGNGISDQVAVSIMKKTFKARLDKLIDEVSKAKMKGDMRSIKHLTSEVPQIIGIEKEIVKTIVASGKAELIINLDKNSKMDLGEFQVNISSQDRPRVSMVYLKDKEQFSINELQFFSPDGFKIYNSPRFPDYAYIKLHSLNVSETYINSSYRISAEDVVSGFATIVKSITYGAAPQLKEVNPYQKFELTALREYIDKKLKSNVKKIIKQNEVELTDAGVKPGIIENRNP